MQVILNAMPDREMLQLLARDMFEHNKKLRYETIIHQIEERIVDKWLLTVKEQRLWDKPVKCVVRFVENKNGSVFEGIPFTLTATLDPYCETDIETYVKRVRNVLTFMQFDLCKYDLDNVEFDIDNETGHESIKVFEYHDVMKGF